MANYTKTAVHGTLIVLVVSLFAAFFGYLVRMVLARNLTVDEFGLFYAVFAFLGFFSAFSTLGFEKSLVKFIPQFLHEKNYVSIKSSIVYSWIVPIITNSMIILGVIISADYLGVNYFHNEKAGIILVFMAVAFALDSFTQTIKFAFQGFKNMVYFSGVDLVRMILVLVAIVIGLKLGYGIFSAVGAYIITPLLLICILGFLLMAVFPEFLRFKLIIDFALFRKNLRYGIFVMSTTVGVVILGYTDTIMLTYFVGLADVALYNIALPTAKLFLYFPRAIGGIFLPLTSEFWAKKEESLLSAGLQALYKYSAIIIVPAALIVLSFSDLIISVFFGNSYAQASTALKILVVGMIFATINSISLNFFSGIGKPEISSKIVYSAAAFNMISNLIFIPIFGINGAALTTSISYFIMMVIGLLDTRKFTDAKLPLWVWAKTLIAGLALVALVYTLKNILSLNVWLETAIILAIAGLAYTTLLFLLKIVNAEEIKRLIGRVVY